MDKDGIRVIVDGEQDDETDALFRHLLSLPVGLLMDVAVSALAIYDALERPDERGSMACYAEALPHLQLSLETARLL